MTPKQYYHIRARRRSDFAEITAEAQDEAQAHRIASRHFAQGCDVTVSRVEIIAEWKDRTP